jgi:hypothetical protein
MPEAATVFLAAKASARPRMAQLTTIRAMNRPSTLYRSCSQALSPMSTKVTRVAIRTM